MIGIQISEIAGFAIEIEDECEIDGISDDSCGVHEVVCDFLTHEENDLLFGRTTNNGAKKLAD